MKGSSSADFKATAPVDADANRFGRGLLGLVILVAVVLAALGYSYCSHLQADASAAARQELSTIADLKLQEILHWRRERLADADFFSRARFVAEDVGRLLREPDSEEAKQATLSWVKLLKGGDRYSRVAIVDVDGRPVLSLPGIVETPQRALVVIEKAVRSRGVVMGDLHRDKPGGGINLDIAFPVFEEADSTKGDAIAAVFLELDARQFLFPLIQSWPTPSQTAETLLVRREGDDILFLNDVRHRTNSALEFRVSAALPELPAGKVMRGETRVVDGLDYRGEPVVAAGRLIPGTSWGMVAKIDRAEVYGPLYERMVMGALVLAMGLVVCVLVAGLVWRQHRNGFLQRELALEKERAVLAERLTQLMRHANDTILLMRSDGKIIEANECALKTYGYTLQELQQKRVHELRTPEAALTTDRDLAEVGSVGSRFFETHHQRKDGTVFPVEVSSRKIAIAGEEWILSIVRDTTERKKAEEALHRSEARLMQAVELGRLGTFEHDQINEELEYSPVMRELMRFGPAEEVTFQAFMERVFPEDREALSRSIQRGHDPAGDGVLATEFRLGPFEGHVCWMSVRAQTFFKGEGSGRRPARTIGAVLDVTEHKESQARLERLVKERTARLQQAVEELEHFSYTITHDMRAPLRAMQGFAEMMLETCGGDGQSKLFLTRIMTSAERMDHLIRDALNYTKVVRAELPLDAVDAGALLRGMLDTYPEFQESRASIRLEGDIPLVIGNKAGLTQCFSNLLTNAIKFVKPGEKPNVRIWAERRDEWVRFWIEDQGIGIPRKMIPRLFQMFERGNHNQEGTGIGLALVRKVAERMSGRVGVESEEGRGSRFWMELRSSEQGEKRPQLVLSAIG